MTKNKYIIFGISFLLMLIFLHLNHYTYVSDDLWFSEVSKTQTNHFQWVISRYNNWSSRTPIEYALITLINNFNVWSILNSFIFAIFVLSATLIGKGLVSEYYKLVAIATFVICLCSIPSNILFDGVVWVTGSFNYLWPVSFAFLGYSLLIPSLQRESDKKNRIYLCIIAFLLSSFNEQIAVVNFIVSISMMIWCSLNGKNIKNPILTLLATSLIIAYIATCPGNKVRYTLEVARWFSGYSELSFIQRALFGLNIYADSLFSHKTIVPAIAAFSISLICRGRTRYFPILSGCVLLLISLTYNTSDIFVKTQFTDSTIYSSSSIIRVFYAFMITSMMILPVIISRKKDVICFLITAMTLSAVASSSMLGFSPTVYASGDRVLFVTYSLFSLISVICCIELSSKIHLKK